MQIWWEGPSSGEVDVRWEANTSKLSEESDDLYHREFNLWHHLFFPRREQLKRKIH